MPLAALRWRYVGSAAPAVANNVPSALDALYTLLNSATYYNGAARTGQPTAWTWNQESPAGTTVANYGGPPTNPLTMKYIVGGIAAAAAYPIAAPDVAVLNNAIVCEAVQGGTGAYTNWQSATPFTTGFISGYWRATPTLATAITDIAYWECEEACIIQFGYAAGATRYIAFGALFDPLVYVSGVTCQTDNRMYFMFSSGSTSAASATWLSLPSSDGTMVGGGTNTANTAQGGYFAADGSGAFGGVCTRIGTFFPNAALLTLGNEAVVIPFATYRGLNMGPFLGMSREFGIVKDTISKTVWSNAGTDLGYVVGYSTTTAGDCIALKV